MSIAGEGRRGVLRLRPITLKAANAFIAQHHRHHKPTVGHKFSLAVYLDDELVGVAILGRPVARAIDASEVLEVTRLCSDGTPNVPSLLYAAGARIAQEMGYQRIQTYILNSEPGTTLKAAGWMFEAEVKGRDWNTPARGGRRTDQPMVDKQRWGKALRPQERWLQMETKKEVA